MKHGVHPEDHAAVYSSRRDGPSYHEGEDRLLTKKAIRVEIKDPSHKLDPYSRLNYAKIYTVEHNVKVLFIGWVAENYEQAVATAFNDTHPPIPPRPHADRPESPAFSHSAQADPHYPAAAMPMPSTTSWSQSSAAPFVSSSYPGPATTFGYSGPAQQPYTHPLVFSAEVQVPPRATEQPRQDDYDQAPAGGAYDSSNLYDP